MRRPAGWDLFANTWRSYLLTAVLVAVVLVTAGVVGPGGGLFDLPGKMIFTAPPGGKIDALRYWWVFTVPLLAALFVQHRWPVPALLLTVAGMAGHIWLDRPISPVDFVVAVTLYTVADRARSRLLTAGSTAALAIGVVLAFLFLTPKAPLGGAVADGETKAKSSAVATSATKPAGGGGSYKPLLGVVGQAIADGMGIILVFACAAALGDNARTRRQNHRLVEQRVADLDLDRRRQVELAAAGERTRISRELHDVVAHSLTVMVAQAQAAEAAHQRRPDRSRAAMAEVVTTGRAAIGEIRRLLGTVAGPPGDEQPGLAHLAELLDRVRATGTEVGLDVDGQPVPLPSAADLTAYRIVQEALTNTLKHAGPGARADVRLAFGGDRVDVEITDDGAGAAGPPGDGPPGDGPPGDGPPGNGLRGIAERVRALGGHLDVGPVAGGGFRVRARLRYDADPA